VLGSFSKPIYNEHVPSVESHKTPKRRVSDLVFYRHPHPQRSIQPKSETKPRYWGFSRIVVSTGMRLACRRSIGTGNGAHLDEFCPAVVGEQRSPHMFRENAANAGVFTRDPLGSFISISVSQHYKGCSGNNSQMGPWDQQPFPAKSSRSKHNTAYPRNEFFEPQLTPIFDFAHFPGDPRQAFDLFSLALPCIVHVRTMVRHGLMYKFLPALADKSARVAFSVIGCPQYQCICSSAFIRRGKRRKEPNEWLEIVEAMAFYLPAQHLS
jgi:hypothetical protein